MAQGHSLKTLLAVGAACSAVSSIGTAIVKSKDSAEAHIRFIALAVADPIRQDLAEHTKLSDAAMAPGGIMNKKFSRMESRVDWLVKERICRTVPNQPCPPFVDVIAER